jgi:NAD(P)-dependent dehydrogenase (short-subunit alcohol dehydrogenase family)
MKLQNRVAVITGAAGGIGLGLATALARRGCHLALCDVNGSALEEAGRDLGSFGVRVSTHRLDVRDRGAIAAFPAEVLRRHAGVDLLVNNAGVALGGTFEQVSEEDFDWVMDINFHAVVRLTRAFLPELRRSAEARIVNISSVFGLVSPAGQAAYSASKFAVRGFSNALRHELAGCSVGVTVVHPGGVATSIAKNARIAAAMDPAELERKRARADKLLRMPPMLAGELIARGVERDSPRVLIGADAKVAAVLERLMPVGYWKLMRRLME